MGTDSRNAPGSSGTISLVSPQLIYAYVGIGGTVTQLRNAAASTSKLSLSFMPEPGRLALLASGLLGLLTLTRLRRHR